MPQLIALPFSIDHQRKKTKTVHLPFSLYLHFILSDEFAAILPNQLKDRFDKARASFEKEHAFLNSEDMVLYEKTPFIRFICGPDLHKFFTKLLSLNYQDHKALLETPAGSIEEFFSDLTLFWNEKYSHHQTQDDAAMRDCLFCAACIQSHHQRISLRDQLKDKLDQFAKDEIKALEEAKKMAKEEVLRLKEHITILQDQLREKETALKEEQQKQIVLVPNDPYHMLGLVTGHKEQVEQRSKSLLKALHPDHSRTGDTAFLFDMVIKARDMIKNS
jgi:hypothetical protein